MPTYFYCADRIVACQPKSQYHTLHKSRKMVLDSNQPNLTAYEVVNEEKRKKTTVLIFIDESLNHNQTLINAGWIFKLAARRTHNSSIYTDIFEVCFIWIGWERLRFHILFDCFIWFSILEFSSLGWQIECQTVIVCRVYNFFFHHTFSNRFDGVGSKEKREFRVKWKLNCRFFFARICILTFIYYLQSK